MNERMEHPDRAEIAVGLVRLVALYDADTASHLQATAILAHRIAVQMTLAAAICSAVELAGLLHDIGKLRVARDILIKPAALSAVEWIEMRLHAEEGANVLAALPRLADLAPIVRAHHERMDGLGYPDRLRGDEISVEARIVAVADAFHALTTDRPYRQAVLPQVALAVLKSAAGPQFDRDVVAATFDLFGHAHNARRRTA